MNRTHASFFSGVGGLDMGLEAAGWETVSFSEIDPYASAVLARHWPAVPNSGDIVQLARGYGLHDPRGRDGTADAGRDASRDGDADLARRDTGQLSSVDPEPRRRGSHQVARSGSGDRGTGRPDVHSVSDGRAPRWADAFLWTGGFPCQDLSVAGKRKGLENVPGLLSSHAGRDFGSLLRRLGELGYWWAYRVLDARYFGVPQRRRRVFIVALHARLDPVGDGPAEVLSVGSRCDRHPATGGQAGPGVAAGAHVGTLRVGGRADGAGSSYDNTPWTVVGSSPDSDRVRAADGLAGRLDDRAELVNALDTAQGGADDNDAQAGRLIEVAPTLLAPGREGGRRDKMPVTLSGPAGDAPLLPDGLDSHRYRCCGNGVVAPVAEFIGKRLRVVCEQLMAERAA